MPCVVRGLLKEFSLLSAFTPFLLLPLTISLHREGKENPEIAIKAIALFLCSVPFPPHNLAVFCEWGDHSFKSKKLWALLGSLPALGGVPGEKDP